MPRCQEGHDSISLDYCDVCGRALGGPDRSETSSRAASSPGPSPESGASGESCPDCGAARTGRFCEQCGRDFTTGTPGVAPTLTAEPEAQTSPAAVRPTEPEPGDVGPAEAEPPQSHPHGRGWIAEVIADRSYFESVQAEGGPDADGVRFPPYCPTRRIPLTRDHIQIGRRSRSKGTAPEIDLTGPPEDPGVSHLHALLLAQPDGSWALVDPGSTNGTWLNDSEDPIEVNILVPLQPGDRVHVGAWTTIVLLATDEELATGEEAEGPDKA